MKVKVKITNMGTMEHYLQIKHVDMAFHIPGEIVKSSDFFPEIECDLYELIHQLVCIKGVFFE